MHTPRQLWTEEGGSLMRETDDILRRIGGRQISRAAKTEKCESIDQWQQSHVPEFRFNDLKSGVGTSADGQMRKK